MSQTHRILTNRAFAALAALLSLCGPLAPGLLADPSVDEQVKSIRSRYDKVEKELSRCRQVKRDLPDESTEGGELVGYFLGESLHKLVAKFYGETGQARSEYYFWDDRLFFILRVESRYDQPLSGKVVSKSEERFYFANDVLIRWLDPRKKEVSAGPDFQQCERDLLTEAKKYSAMVKK